MEKNKDYGMVGGWYYVIDEQGRSLQTIKTLLTHKDISLGLLFRNQFAHSSITIRAALIKKLRYRQDFIYTEDYELWCRIALISKVANLPAFYLAYRWHNKNTCSCKQKELKANVVKLLSEQLDLYEIEHSVQDLAVHSAVCFGYGKYYFNTEEKIKQLNQWLEKVLNSPKIRERYRNVC